MPECRGLLLRKSKVLRYLGRVCTSSCTSSSPSSGLCSCGPVWSPSVCLVNRTPALTRQRNSWSVLPVSCLGSRVVCFHLPQFFQQENNVSAQGIIYPLFPSSMTFLAPISLTVIGGYMSFYPCLHNSFLGRQCRYRYECPSQAEKTSPTSRDRQGGWDGTGGGS